MSKTIIQATIKGTGAAIAMLAIFFLVVTLISGWAFTLGQFSAYWYFIASLAIGFGIQVGFYSYLKRAISSAVVPQAVVAVSGTTSTAAMISCCAHYLANILPVLGIAGLASVVSQYQVEFFWAGILVNVFGIVYIGKKIIAFRNHMDRM